MRDAVTLCRIQFGGTIERRLALAINDLINHRFARGRRQRMCWIAYEWMVADDCEWPFSFVNLCAALRLEAKPIRRRLLDGTIPADISINATIARMVARAPINVRIGIPYA